MLHIISVGSCVPLNSHPWKQNLLLLHYKVGNNISFHVLILHLHILFYKVWKSLLIFLIVLLVFPTVAFKEINEIYVLDTSLLSCFSKYFLPIGGLPFDFLKFLWKSEFLIVIKSVSFFFFYSLYLLCPKRSFSNTKSQNFSPIFFPES